MSLRFSTVAWAPGWVALALFVLVALDATPAQAAGAVAFSSSRGEPDGFVLNNHHAAIWVVNDDGTGMRRLAGSDGIPVEGWDPSWSPLGNALAYVDAAPTEEPIWQLSLVSADGRRRRTLAADGPGSPFDAIKDPDWSPDGRWITFSATTKDRFGPDSARLWQTDIYLASIDGSQVRRITGRAADGGKLYDDEPSFSPDGQRILFTRTTESTLSGTRPPGSGLYSVGLEGGEPKPAFVGEFPNDGRFGSGIPSIRSASFSPDGREIAFLVSDTLYTVGSDARGLRALGRVGSDMIFNTAVVPAWDPAPVFIVSEPFLPLVKVYPNGRTLPLTTAPTHPELRAEFQGDTDPDWRPAVPLPVVADVVPPATFLFDRRRPRPITASAAASRRRSLTLRRGNLSFFAVDPAGVSAVHVAVARGAGGQSGRAMCRFLGARRFSRRARPCGRPRYRRVVAAGSWQRLRRLRPGRYLLWLRTTDGRGAETRTRAVRVSLRR